MRALQLEVVYIKRASVKLGEAGSLTTQMYLHWSGNNENIAQCTCQGEGGWGGVGPLSCIFIKVCIGQIMPLRKQYISRAMNKVGESSQM